MGSPHKGPLMRSFDIGSAVNLNKLLNKLLTCRWHILTSYHCNVNWDADVIYLHTSDFVVPFSMGPDCQFADVHCDRKEM